VVFARCLGALILIAFVSLAPAVAMADDYVGGAGDDTHDHANVTNDTIDGNGGDDTLDGSGGDDVVSGGTGVDAARGGDGNDTVYGESAGGAVPLDGEADTAVLGSAGDDTVMGDGVVGAGAASGSAPDLVGGDDQHVEGDDGADFVYGDGGVSPAGPADQAVLDGGNDIIWGDSPFASPLEGNDVIFGDGDANATLGALLLGGDDEIHAGGGDDQIWGDGRAGASDDALAQVVGGADTIFGDAGNDTIHGDGSADGPHVNGASQIINSVLGGDDTVHGGDGNDFIWGEGLNYGFVPSGGDDTLFGDAGFDTIFGQTGQDTIDGGDDDDVVSGEANGYSTGFTGEDDIVHGGAGADAVYGDGSIDTNDGLLHTLVGGDDEAYGDDGNDVVKGDGTVQDFVDGSQLGLQGGHDQVFGGAGEDDLEGDGDVEFGAGGSGALVTLLGGDDTLDGGADHDEVRGDGNAELHGSGTAEMTGGADHLIGGDGDDLMWGDGWVTVDIDGDATLHGGNDTLDGGLGADVLYGDGLATVFGTGTATIYGGDDELHGGDGNDTLFGEAQNGGFAYPQVLIGGDDQLFGEGGDDTINGESGNDYLCGGEGDDVLKGGDGIDLACAVDDAIDVEVGKGGTLDVSINDEKLDDETAEERAATHYSIVSLSPGIAAVIDEHTGVITFLSADQDGEVQYQVIRDGNPFATLAMVLVTVFEGTDPPPNTDPEPPPNDDGDGGGGGRDDDPDRSVIDGPAVPIDVPVLAPVETPVENPIESTVPDAVDPVEALPDLTEGLTDARPAAADPETGVDLSDPIAFGATHTSDSFAELLRGPLGPVVVVSVATTAMITVGGGAGIAAQSLAMSRIGSTSAYGPAARARRASRSRARAKERVGRETAETKRAAARSTYESDRFATITRGIGPGDRSKTWRFPGWRPVDAASVAVPHRLAPHSPLAARLAIDGTEVRAMFGSLWTLAPVLGLVVGVLAAQSVDGRAVPPPLWLLLAGAILTTFDALAGAVASTVYIAAGVLSGAMTSAQAPDLVHSVLVYCAVGFLWTSIPLIGSAMRPFRRLGDGSVRHVWDTVADLAIASLLCAWVTRGLMQSMDSFAGEKTGLPAHAGLVALVVLGCVAVRILSENAAARLYPLRLQAVEASSEFPEATVLAGLGGVAFRTFLFSFIGYSFVGHCWQWWAGTALYCAPQILTALGTKFRRVDWIQRLLPRGVTALFVLLVIGAAVVGLVRAAASSDLETVRWVFVLLAVPPLVMTVLKSFTDKESGATTWFQELLGLGVVVATAWLAFNGWST
jgi:Ca2+-binding RTX toxin-like protein